jgi:phosphoglycerol transferase
MRSYNWGSVQGLRRKDQPVAAIASWTLRGVPQFELQSALVLLLIFGALSLCFIVKSLALHYPSIIGDEYYYSILSRYFGDQRLLFAHNRYLPDYPNELYFWLFHPSRLFGDSSYQFAKIFNSLLFAAAIFPLYALLRRFLKHVPALLLSILIVIAPIESYTAYFMPESCYFLGFWLFVFLFVSNLPHRSLIAGILGGVALGLLTLIKPHALAVLGGANLTLIIFASLPETFDLKRRDCVRCFVALNGAWLATVAMLHVMLFGHRDLDIFGIYRATPIPGRLVYTKDMIKVLFGHLAYIAPMFGLPIVVTVLAALGWLPAEVSESRSRLRILSVFAIVVWGCLLVMTGSATVCFGYDSSSDLARMLARYYDFALPMFLISFYAARDSKPPEKVRKLLFYGILACLVLVFVGWRFFAGLRPVNLTDFPEMAWVTQPHHIALSVFWPVAALVLAYYAIVGLKERTTYSTYLVAALVVGSLLTASAQRGFDVETRADLAGVLVRSLFHGKERDHLLVVGSDPVTVRRCLFGIEANPWVLELPAGTTLDRLQIGKEIHWVLALDDYDLRVPSTTLLALPGLKILQLQPQTTGVPEQIRPRAIQSMKRLPFSLVAAESNIKTVDHANPIVRRGAGRPSVSNLWNSLPMHLEHS